MHIKDCEHLSFNNNNRLAWLRGFLPSGFQNILKKHRLSQQKLYKLAHDIRKRLLNEFKAHIWSPRCNLYKEWINSQLTTYKQYCLNKTLHTSSLVNTLNWEPDYALDDIDTPNLPLVNKDYKDRTIMSRLDKISWSINIVNSCIRESINDGIKCSWKYFRQDIKKVVSSRKTTTTTDIHLTDRKR